MQTLTWNRHQQIEAVRDRIWLYLTPAAGVEQLGLDAAALLQLPQVDVANLARVYLLTHPTVEALVEDLPRLARRLTTTTAAVEERGMQRIRGAIDWPTTLVTQAATQQPTLYVTRPTERAYQTPENELLVFVLDELSQLAAQTGWEAATTTIGEQIRRVASAARWWRSNRMLATIKRVPPSPRSIARVRTSRSRLRYGHALAVYDLHQHLIARLDRRMLRNVIEETGLLTRSDATLFELSCTFSVLDALVDAGWQTAPLRLFSGGLHLSATRGDDKTLELWYQRTPRELRRGSRYARSLRAHAVPNINDFRPDLVIRNRTRNGERWIVIEAKMGERRTVQDSARAATADLLGYRRAFDDVLDAQPEPYGIGIVWGADLAPASTGELILCTPDHIPDALHRALL
jgi:hypothetical protein